MFARLVTFAGGMFTLIGLAAGCAVDDDFADPEESTQSSDLSIAGPDRSFSAGDYGTCAIKGDSTLWCWGLATLGNITGVPSPTQIAGTGWTQVAVGALGVCAGKSDGSLLCWGYNADGQVGDGTAGAWRFRPTTKVAGTGWSQAQVSLGYEHACAVKTNGTLWCWGSNEYGELGDGTETNRALPTQVAGAWSQVSAGYYYTCGRKTNNTLWCWGWNRMGVLGDGTTAERWAPRQVAGNDWAQVTMDSAATHTCGLKTDGSLWCWGSNARGQFGNGSTVGSLSPTRVGGVWAQISTGRSHTCGRPGNGSLYCWGANGDAPSNLTGQLGDGTTTQRTVPTRVVGSNVWRSVSVHGDHTCGRTTSGSLLCWGRNTEGQLGVGNFSHRWTPTPVLGTWSTLPPLTGCDSPLNPPYSNCGIYDTSGQTVCYCSRASQWVTEAFFSSSSDMAHWRSVYPTVNVVASGATPYSNTLPFWLKY